MSNTVRSLLQATVAVCVAAAVTWAAGVGGVRRGGLAVVAWCALVAFGINWIAFLFSWAIRTEKFYDLTGSLTYMCVMVFALVSVARYDARSLLLTGLVIVWALRLGSFLFRRVLVAGSDSRFEKILAHPARLFMTWTMQGLWVTLTLAAALAAVGTAAETDLGWIWIPGSLIWVSGFAVEVTADLQKSAFNADRSNSGGFISSGVWAWSRHPNYFGEITLWIGIAVIALPALNGWTWVTLISPVFVYVLLRYISGVPLLERRASRRWGGDEAWQVYQRNTPVLFPRPPR